VFGWSVIVVLGKFVVGSVVGDDVGFGVGGDGDDGDVGSGDGVGFGVGGDGDDGGVGGGDGVGFSVDGGSVGFSVGFLCQGLNINTGGCSHEL